MTVYILKIYNHEKCLSMDFLHPYDSVWITWRTLCDQYLNPFLPWHGVSCSFSKHMLHNPAVDSNMSLVSSLSCKTWTYSINWQSHVYEKVLICFNAKVWNFLASRLLSEACFMRITMKHLHTNIILPILRTSLLVLKCATKSLKIGSLIKN